VTFLLFKQARTFGTTLVFYLSIGDLLHCVFAGWVPWAFHSTDQITICRIQAFMLSFSDVSSLMWSFCIGVSVFYAMYFSSDQGTGEMPTRYFHLLSWGYALIAAFVPLFLDDYHFLHESQPHLGCWINRPRAPTRLFLYVAIIVIFIFLSIINILIFCRYKRKGSAKEIRRYIRIMRLYLLAFVLSQFPPFVYRLENFIAPSNPIFVLEMGQIIFHPLQGLFDCIVYGFAEPVFKEQYYVAAVDVWGRIKRKFKKQKYSQLPTSAQHSGSLRFNYENVD